MNELRWILIVCGALLLVGIYFWGRKDNKKAKGGEGVARNRMEPQFEPAPALAERFEPSLAQDLEEPWDTAEPEPDIDEESFVSEPEPEVRRAAPTSAHSEPVAREPRRARVEPTFTEELASATLERSSSQGDEMLTAEMPARESTDAPTLSMSETPQPRRIERRKIVALRLAAPSQRYPGQLLRDALEAEGLQHGKYDVFHRLSESGASIFSIASMVEPGTFDLEQMSGSAYPGVTLFAQLPGPIAGAHAVQELVTCGKRLQETLGGTLQDDRGVPLTVHRIERLRQEVIDFERSQSRDTSRGSSSPAF
jgi:cell division protein ZipA